MEDAITCFLFTLPVAMLAFGLTILSWAITARICAGIIQLNNHTFCSAGLVCSAISLTYTVITVLFNNSVIVRYELGLWVVCGAFLLSVFGTIGGACLAMSPLVGGGNNDAKL